jgi:hypothetical protein
MPETRQEAPEGGQESDGMTPFSNSAVGHPIRTRGRGGPRSRFQWRTGSDTACAQFPPLWESFLPWSGWVGGPTRLPWSANGSDGKEL